MLLMSLFGAAALLLAAIGIYGLMAYSVEQRTQEIGIRIALGARADKVRWSIVGQGMTLVGARYRRRDRRRLRAIALHRVVPLLGDAARFLGVFIGAPVLLAAVAFLATWIPALRASRVNPVDALRGE